MFFKALGSRVSAALLSFFLAAAPAVAQFVCNAPSEGFGSGIPAGWSVVDDAGNDLVWGDLAACGEAGNYTGGSGGAACVSSDVFGQAEFDTALVSPVFSLAGATSASLDFNANYQSFAGSDFLDVDISTDGGASWTTLVRWNEDHGAFRSTPGELARVDLSPFLGMSNLRVRWRYYDPNTADWDWYAQVDDVKLTCPVCSGTLLPDPITDGGFEAGSPSTAWTEASANFGTPLCSPALCGFAGARTGSWWAFFGGVVGAPETASLQQSVVLSPGQANLTFFLWNPESGNTTDALRVLVDGTQVLSIPAGNSIYAAGYTRVVVDLSAFADGGSHTVRLEAATSGSPSNTNFFVDDISLSLCEPPPTALAVNDASVTEGNAGTTNLTFTVTLAPSSGQTVTVDYATADGTATAGADYTAGTGTLQFLAGETTKTVTVAVAGDTIDEIDETFTLSLSNAVNASIADAQGVGTIVDDDTATVTIGPASLAENGGSLSFPVTLSTASSGTVTVDFTTADGTATAGSDYTAGAGTVTFAPGETAKTISVAVLNDPVDEEDETFTVSLASPVNAALGTPSSAVGTILDDDVVSVSIGGALAVEGNAGSVNAVFTATLSTSSTRTVTVDAATANGTATAGADYTAAGPSTITFAPGQTTQTFAVAVLGDTIDEDDETFTVNLSNPVNATISAATGVGTIQDDDTSEISIADASVQEGGSGNTPMTFTATLSVPNSRTVTVQYQTAAGGATPATAGTDYQAVTAPVTLTFLAGETSKTFGVQVVGDTVDEADETFLVNLSGASNAAIADGSAVGTIQDDDTASLALNDPAVTEGNSGTANLAFVVTLSTASDHTVTVDFQTVAGGTATAGTDYVVVAATPLTFAAGETTKTVNVTVNGDTVDENDETVLATIANAAGAPIGDANGTGTITDDDTASIAITDVTVAEPASGTANAVLTVTLSNASDRTVTVDAATANGTATAGSDYVALAATTLTFAAGETSKTVTVTVNTDTIDEIDETFSVNLSNASNATVGDAQGVGTITDDDTSSITINDVSVTEGNSGTVTAGFTVSLSVANSRNVTVTWQTANGTATAGSDYVAVAATTLTIPAGQTSGTVNVTVNGDTIDEINEAFNVNLSSPGNAVIGDAQGVGTINDDDAAAFSVNDPSVTEGDSGTVNAAFTVSLSNASSQAVTVTVQTANGTAAAGSDYVAVSATVLTFNPGETSKTVNVAVNGDLIDEDNETFTLNLSNATGGATIADAAGVATIVDNDTSTITIADAGKAEGNSGTSVLNFTVTLSRVNSRTVTVQYATANGTATAPSDYVAASNTLSLPAGATTGTIPVTINGDTTGEPDETFVVNLSSPANATIADGQATGTITNDDTPTIPVPDVSISEGSATDLTYTVTLSSPASQTVTVNYTTADAVALATTDYVTTSGTLTFNPGESSKSFTVALRRDTLPEHNERLFLNFSNPVNALLPDNRADVTITDDDANSYASYQADASAIPGCFVMADTWFEKGAVYPTKSFSLANKFDMTFAVSFGKHDASGGGGLVWLLTPNHVLGSDDMGYHTISPSLGVEIDTVQNFVQDPEEDHIAIDHHGATCCHSGAPPVQASATSANIEDNLEHELRIKRDPTSHRMDVWFDGVSRQVYVNNIVSQLFSGNPTVYWGFTGANNCNDSTCPSNVLYWCPIAVCIGDTATPHVLADDITASEGAASPTAVFKVRLFCPRSETVTVNYATANNTATAGFDYVAASGTLTFAPGETEKTVTVTLLQDSVAEPDENFFLTFSSPSNNLSTPDATAVAWIVDDFQVGFGIAGDVPLSGDWNGDGIDTIGVFRNGTFYLRNSNTPGPADIQFNFGNPSDQVVAGDWNGDGIDTVGVYNGTTFFLKSANTAAASSTAVGYGGVAGDKGLAGDWNGDGIDTIGVQRGSQYLLRNTNTSGAADISFFYGSPTDIGIMGDWNNDGIDTVGVFRDTIFFLRNSNTSGAGEINILYGNAGDRPVVGDRDGNGDDTVGFYRKGTFWLRR
jgi:Calx-beta domain